jgi:predicted amidohydrolase
VVRVGACQTREILGDVDAAVGVVHDFARQADGAGVDLLLFPECFLVPAQNMMRRDKALWWKDRHNQIRAQRVHETGMWLVSADVTGERDGTRIGLGPTCAINPAGQVVTQVPTGATGMAIAEIHQP